MLVSELSTGAVFRSPVQLSSSPRQFLRLLLWLRLGAVLGQSLTVLVVWRWLHVALPLHALTLTIGALGLAAALSALRLRLPLQATQLEIACQLLIDVLQLTVLLYLSGGTTNPFASLYLIPIALVAVGLGWRYLCVIALVCLAAYGWLITHFLALDYPGSRMEMMPDGTMMRASGAFDLHVAGMQITFLLSCALLASALSIMAAQIRRRDRQAAVLREDALRHEHLGALGILAAGAAHELSTPLLSMSLLVEELQATSALDAQSRDDLHLLGRQIELCKDKLNTLLQTARQPRADALRVQPLQQLLQETLEKWQLVRPTVRLDVRWQPDVGAPPEASAAGGGHRTLLRADAGFAQALTSLLDNAADASAATGSDRVALSILCDEQQVQISIDDEGPGLDEHLQRHVGKALFTTKSHGFGLGLVLSHANLNRLQGDVRLSARRDGGTRTLITLPRYIDSTSAPSSGPLHG